MTDEPPLLPFRALHYQAQCKVDAFDEAEIHTQMDTHIIEHEV